MSGIRVSIFSEGKELKNLPNQITHLEIQQEVNRIPFAQITLHDGNAALRNFFLSNAAELAPGKMLSIKIAEEGGAAGADKPALFNGMICRHGIEAAAEGLNMGSYLTLELQAQSFHMTQKPQSRVFQEMTDAQIIKQIIEEYGLISGEITETEVVHKEMVQYGCSDWDFLLARADLNGWWVLVRWDEEGQEVIDVVRPDLSGEPVETFTFGMSPPVIYNFEMETDLNNQHEEFQAAGWDSANQQMTRSVSAGGVQLMQGDLDPAELAASLGTNVATLKSATETKEEELQTWANASMIKSRLALIRGRLSTRGTDRYQLNQPIALDGMGDHFNGETPISGIRQEVSISQGWQTSLQFGLPAEWYTLKHHLESLPASGMLPAINGLHIGILEGYEQDQENKLLAKIRVPAVDAVEGLLWARLASPYAGNNHGFFFRPEIGDEVVVGFFDDDPRHPVVLGSLYSAAHLPPIPDDQLKEENDAKGWISREGIKMVWDEKEPSLLLVSKGEGGDEKSNQMLLGGKEVKITDIHGNSIVMDKNGITIKSKKAVAISGPKVDVN
ncbi:MAG: type VI secretion system tip protein VgrG [Lewinellaceae bacterium]|nr:type VI secretion system tip protein VgrG [Lewinellaceae bacterium]